MKEAVMYLLIKGDQVLVEFRPLGEKEVMHIPGGGIEDTDKTGEGNYKEYAMMREIREELQGGVSVKEHTYIGNVIRHDIQILFHIFFITTWEGEIPSHILEKDELPSRLEWISIYDAIEIDTNTSRIFALQKAKEYISSKHG